MTERLTESSSKNQKQRVIGLSNDSSSATEKGGGGKL